jgi:spore coat polysaccharide biosynthesis predicted glycosyltransferase SpsG/RimJ/RimL family protein N-acetyltransferase
MWKPPQTLVLRVDSSVRSDNRRFFRCLALAQSWVDAGSRAVFVTSAADLLREARLAAEEIECVCLPVPPGSREDARATADFARECAADWVVSDGAPFGVEYQRALREAGLRVAAFDDDGRKGPLAANVVVNPALGANEDLYPGVAAETQFLLGPRYAPLRREFARWAQWKRTIPQTAKKLLVAFDSATPGAAARVVRRLPEAGLADLEVVVIETADSASDTDLRVAAVGVPMRVRLRPNITAMPALLAWADVGVSSGAAPSYEWLLMGLASLFLVLSEAERPLADHLAGLGVGAVLGDLRSLGTPDAARRLTDILTAREDRAAMSRACRKLVDAEGAERIRLHLSGQRLRLRKMRADDCGLLWQWTHEPGVRESFVTHQPASWNAFVPWFAKKLADPHSRLFIAVDRSDLPVGSIRFEISGRTAQVSLLTDESHRAEGPGRSMVEMGVAHMFQHTWVEEIHALLMPRDEPSLKMFDSLGYQRFGMQQLRGHMTVHFVLTKSMLDRS